MSTKVTARSGQIVLITLLVLTIATTIALSLISRTTTDTSITAQVEQSSRAFSAAEAGVEEALKGITVSGVQTLSAGVTYKVEIGNIGDAIGVYGFPKNTQKGVTETLWLAPHDDVTGAILETDATRYKASTIDVCWSSGPVVPALLVTVLYKEQSTGSYQVLKAAFDPDGVRAATNKFVSTYTPGGCGGNSGTNYKERINFTALNASVDPATDYLIALRIRPLYSDTQIAIDTAFEGVKLPLQGKSITSTGTTGDTNRKIVVYQQYKAPSTIFDAAVYSQSSLIQ